MVIGKADVSWTGSTVIVARTTELAEQLLTDGELRCPLCNTGQLVAWGYGRKRIVRGSSWLRSSSCGRSCGEVPHVKVSAK